MKAKEMKRINKYLAWGDNDYAFTEDQLKAYTSKVLKEFIKKRKTFHASDRITAKHLINELFDGE